jgi:hydrogenase nickel incorporation protein HypA/HybF
MHELSAATAVLRTVLKAAEGRNLKRITGIKLQIGELTLINPEQLEFCFGVAARDSIAEGAKLEIQSVPGELRCRKCGSAFNWTLVDDDPALHLVGPRLSCECGSGEVEIVAGREMSVVSMTVEQPRGA